MSTNKSFSTETSERYSRALYEVGKESSELEKIEANVKNFQTVYENNVEIKNFIQNPTHRIETQNKVVDILSKELSFSKDLKNFFLLLIKKKRIFFVNKILNSFLKLCTKNRGEVKADLISSKELSLPPTDMGSLEVPRLLSIKSKFHSLMNGYYMLSSDKTHVYQDPK